LRPCLFVCLLLALCPAASRGAAPTFYRDVLPILQQRCQSCHRPGEIGPMPLVTWEQTRPWAKAIREAVVLKKMPPWFADPRFGEFANDPSLQPAEVAMIDQWVAAGAPAGTKAEAPPPVAWPSGSNLPGATVRTRMPQAFRIAAGATVPYQSFVLPAEFTRDAWASAIEIRPSDRSVVHHAVLYVRERGATWLDKPPASADVLAVYTPGAPVTTCPDGMAKKIPAGASLVLQMHYTSKKTAASDQTAVALVTSASVPRSRVLTLQMDNTRLRIPPGEREYRASAAGTLQRDAVLLGMFPHMHLRGTGFAYQIAGTRPGEIETLLQVNNYDFHWQLYYRLKTPRTLRAGTRLIVSATYDNSARNPRNPDPDAEVTWGEQSEEEMLVGFFDVAVPPEVGKEAFLAR
jgi:Copper type II ascorbate-dependent monooxygenase, C-terminal domain